MFQVRLQLPGALVVHKREYRSSLPAECICLVASFSLVWSVAESFPLVKRGFFASNVCYEVRRSGVEASVGQTLFHGLFLFFNVYQCSRLLVMSAPFRDCTASDFHVENSIALPKLKAPLILTVLFDEYIFFKTGLMPPTHA